jgi:hypothetical protein
VPIKIEVYRGAIGSSKVLTVLTFLCHKSQRVKALRQATNMHRRPPKEDVLIFSMA